MKASAGEFREIDKFVDGLTFKKIPLGADMKDVRACMQDLNSMYRDALIDIRTEQEAESAALKREIAQRDEWIANFLANPKNVPATPGRDKQREAALESQLRSYAKREEELRVQVEMLKKELSRVGQDKPAQDTSRQMQIIKAQARVEADQILEQARHQANQEWQQAQRQIHEERQRHQAQLIEIEQRKKRTLEDMENLRKRLLDAAAQIEALREKKDITEQQRQAAVARLVENPRLRWQEGANTAHTRF